MWSYLLLKSYTENLLTSYKDTYRLLFYQKSVNFSTFFMNGMGQRDRLIVQATAMLTGAKLLLPIKNRNNESR
jgi:hypothetical protein